MAAAAFGKKISTFGRQCFDLYDKYPLFCNTVAGSAVYSMGEFVVQYHTHSVAMKKLQSVPVMAPSTPIGTSSPLPPPPRPPAAPPDIDYGQIRQIGLLGGVENGFFMYCWYSLLNYAVGSSRATSVVLVKCALDQAFFATQQDGVFLAVCAIQHQGALADAVRCVKRDFLTTWINDCSIWPLINFVGFAAVPVKIQPTFMSCAQLFWQVYMSSVAASSTGEVAEAETITKSSSELREDAQLAMLELAIFRSMDLDGNGFLDADEMRQALQRRGVEVSAQEVEIMIREVNAVAGVGVGGGGNGDDRSTKQVSLGAVRAMTKMQKTGLQSHESLEKGAKKLLRRIADQKRKAVSADPAEEEAHVAHRQNLGFLAYTTDTVKAVLLEQEDVDKYGQHWKDNRQSAIHNSLVGGGALLIVALVRKLVFKI